jgi:hypothetical protein
MINKYGTVGEIRICKSNRSARRKPTPVPLCPPPEIPQDLTFDKPKQPQWELTAWPTARFQLHADLEWPPCHFTFYKTAIRNID